MYYKVKLIFIKKLTEIAFQTLAVLILLLALAFSCLSFSKVQTLLAQKITHFLEEKYGFVSQIDRVKIRANGDLELENLLIKDHKKDTLISVKHISGSLYDISQLQNSNANFKSLNADGAFFHIKTHSKDSINNLSTFINKVVKNKKKQKSSLLLKIKNAHIKNSMFRYSNLNINAKPIVSISDINLEASKLHITPTSFDTQINHGEFTFNNIIKIKDLKASTQLKKGVMQFKDIVLQSKTQSKIYGDLSFHFTKDEFKDFLNKVHLKANVSNSQVATKDINAFYNLFQPKHFFKIPSGKIRGTLNNLNFEKLHIQAKGSSSFQGKLIVKNAFSRLRKQNFECKTIQSSIDITQNTLKTYLLKKLTDKIPTALDPLKTIKITGDQAINASEIFTKNTIQTDFGTINTHITLKNWKKAADINYTGEISAQLTKAYPYLKEHYQISKIGFNFKSEGKNIALENHESNSLLYISNMELRGYNFQNIYLNSDFYNQVLKAKLNSFDKNFKLKGKTEISFKDPLKSKYLLDIETEFMDLKKIKVFERDEISQFTGKINADFSGTSIENLKGELNFSNAQYTNENSNYLFKDLKINTNTSATGIKSINIQSPDIIDGKLQGYFQYKNIPALLENSLSKILTGESTMENQFKNYEYLYFDFKIFNKIIDVLFPGVAFSYGTAFKGNLSTNASEFRVFFSSPFAKFHNTSFKDLDFKLDNTKSDTTNNNYNSLIQFKKFDNPYYPISNFKLYNQIEKDTLISTINFERTSKIWKSKKESKEANTRTPLQNKHTDSLHTEEKDVFKFRFSHYKKEAETSYNIGLRKGYATINKQLWEIEPKKEFITFSKGLKNIKIDTLKSTYQKQEILFLGYKKALKKYFKLKTNNLDISNLIPKTKKLDFAGKLSAELELRTTKGKIVPVLKGDIKHLSLNNEPLGTFFFNAKTQKSQKTFEIEGYTKYKTKIPFHVNGIIDIKNIEKPQLKVKTSFKDFKIAPFSPLGGIVLSNLRGAVTGNIAITGELFRPDFKGQLRLQKVGLKFPYLNTDFKIKNYSKVVLKNNKILFNEHEFSDTKYNTKGYLSGSIFHEGLNKWNLDLNIHSNRLLVLNTTSIDNDLYYGKAFINGKAVFKGPTDKLFIGVTASSEKGTQFKIPISDTEDISGDHSYIHFITPEEKEAANKGGKVTFEDLKGLEMQFDLDINKNAEVEVVVDPVSGSSLKGSGAGTLLFEINTRGKFNMWGDFIAYKGSYDFRYKGLVSKRFDVKPGGSINWNGNPTGAQLNLEAVYNTKANPSILLENNAVNQKIDVKVITLLKGELLKPNLDFQIEFPTASATIRSELGYLLADQSTKEQQALSLMSQGQFYADTLFGDQAITENLFERASSIVNSLFSSDEDKFTVGLDYIQGDRSADQEISDRFGISVTTKISDRILVNGKVGVPVGGISESVVVGDVQIDFLLNKDGSLRANIFSKQNDIQFIGEADGYTQGVGLSYSYDFNSFKSLIRSILSKNQKSE